VMSQQRVRDDLIPRIKSLAGRGCARSVPSTVARPAAPVTRPAPVSRHGVPGVSIVAIGVSTGGPNALAELISALPAHFPVPVVIVQHMPPMFTRLLAERLDGQSPLAVREASHGLAIEPGSVTLARGDHHMVLERHGTGVRVALNQDPPENSCRPAVDPMLRSAAAIYGPRTLALILTGMGQDGLHGCQVVHEAGGQVLVQDEASSVVWGMPGFVARAGLADRILPLSQLAAEIERRVTSTASPAPSALRVASRDPRRTEAV